MRLWTLQCGNCLCRRAVPTIQGSDKKYEDYEKRLINCKKDKENKWLSRIIICQINVAQYIIELF